MRPEVSVVVPTCNRHELLNRCLAALLIQDLPCGQYEVVVVDDGASEATRRLVETWADRVKLRLRYVQAGRNRGPAAARNTGWRAAQADIIAFTDDDCVASAGWLQAGLEALADGVDGAWGRLIMPLPAHPTDYQRHAAHLEKAEFVTANCFYRRSALEKVGGFDERFTTAWREDSDLFFSLLERDARFVYSAEAVVVHPVRAAGWGVSIGQQRKSMFNALLYKKHPVLYRQRIQKRPPWMYYAVVTSAILAAGGALLGSGAVLLAGAAVWAALTLWFCLARLRRTSRAPEHVVEMIVTSALIPPLAVFWRLAGAVRFGVFFL